MTRLASVPAPWWVLATLVVVGLGVGVLLARRLATTAYRLDDEVGPAPAPAWTVVLAVPVLWAALAHQVGGVAHGAVLPAFLLLAVVGVALFWIDLDVHRLPEGLTLPTVPALLTLLAVASVTTGDWGALLRGVLAGLAVGLAYLVLALVNPGGLGLGDATLGLVVSLPLGYLGWSVPVVGVLATYVVGGVVSLALVVTRRVKLKGAIAFGPFILVGTVVSLFTGFQHLGA